ncbi:MAG TPA: NAD(+)/NADH kinase [Solirubrobacteraceae bacterium]
MATSGRQEISHERNPGPAVLARIGLVTHPSRAIDGPLLELREWAARCGVDLVQVYAFCRQKQVAERGDAVDCDLIVSIGGDGTTLAAIHAGVEAGRPVLGVSCGSLGVLTTVAPDGVARALDRFSAGDWVPRLLPALDGTRDGADPVFALNDIALVRVGEGQVRVRAVIDGTLFARVAGDGCVVSTQLGSSAYSLSAGGPLLAPGTHGFVFTPLYPHGGSCPPLVLTPDSELELEITTGFGGVRLEVDGQVVAGGVGQLRIRLCQGVATVVGFSDQEPFVAGLRRRGIIADSPRFIAEDARG